MNTKLFKADLNLDDEAECTKFLKDHSHDLPPRRLARKLGFTGQGAVTAAKALWNYAMNRRVAFTVRREGRIATAEMYEGICDRIYKQDIQPHIECW